MSHPWVKEFKVDVAEGFPYLKIILKIAPTITIPFYGFTVKVKIQSNSGYIILGDFLYTG